LDRLTPVRARYSVASRKPQRSLAAEYLVRSAASSGIDFTRRPRVENTGTTNEQTTPATPATDNPEQCARVQAIIDEVRPYIQGDGGDVELLKVEDNIVYVRLNGACIGCPSSMMTLKGGIEARVREEIPEIESVEMV
jgi:Fe-S cluster biogenesis protein NfuA